MIVPDDCVSLRDAVRYIQRRRSGSPDESPEDWLCQRAYTNELATFVLSSRGDLLPIPPRIWMTSVTGGIFRTGRMTNPGLVLPADDGPVLIRQSDLDRLLGTARPRHVGRRIAREETAKVQLFSLFDERLPSLTFASGERQALFDELAMMVGCDRSYARKTLTEPYNQAMLDSSAKE